MGRTGQNPLITLKLYQQSDALFMNQPVSQQLHFIPTTTYKNVYRTGALSRQPQ